MSGQRADVMRLDFGAFSKVERTPQGGLRIPANLTRVGVFVYRKADGTERRELREPAEVFHADSLGTLRSAPVTDLHPTDPVRPSNWKSLSVGHVGEDVKQDGKFVAAPLMIQDEHAIRAVERGDRKELSCGYTCQLEETAGSFRGERYDAIQRRIRYNHVAIGPSGWGRAGNDVALRLDANDAIQVLAESPPQQPKERSTMQIKIDGVDYEAGSTQHIQAEQRRHDRLSGEITTLTTERDELKTKADTLEGERDELKIKADAADDPTALDAAVTARVKLHTDAKMVLGDEAKLTGKSDRDVMIEVIKHDDKDFDPTDRSDDYIVGRFDTATRASKRHDMGGTGIGAMRSAAVAATRTDDKKRTDGEPTVDRYDARGARQRMLDNNKNAASAPLRFHREN